MSMLIQDKISYDVINLLCEIPNCTIKVTDGPTISMFYREFSKDRDMDTNAVNDQKSRLQTYLHQLDSITGPLIFCGDMNIDLNESNIGTGNYLKYQKLREILKDFVQERNFSQLILGCTRFKLGDNPSLLDQIYTNDFTNVERIFNKGICPSDHNLIGLRYTLSGKSFKPQVIRFRNFEDVDYEEFSRRLLCLGLNDIKFVTDPDVCVTMLTDMIVKVTDELAPLKTIQKKERYAGWMTKEIKKKINKRNYLHDRAKKTGSEVYWSIFRRYRNRLKSEMRSLKVKIKIKQHDFSHPLRF